MNCPHPLNTRTQLICAHLLGTSDGDYHRWYTGVGAQYALVCPTCAKDAVLRDASVLSACQACFDKTAAANTWDGTHGTPVIAERPTTLHFVHRTVRLPEGCAAPLRAIVDVEWQDNGPQTVDDRPWSARYLALDANAHLLRLDLGASTARLLATLPEDALDLTAPVEMIVAADGRVAAVYNPYGSTGIVLDLASGATTMRLDRRNYHTDVSHFSVAFWVHANRTLLVHARVV